MNQNVKVLLLAILILLIFGSYLSVMRIEEKIKAQNFEIDEKNRMIADKLKVDAEQKLLDAELAHLSLKNKELLDLIGEDAGTLLDKYKQEAAIE